MQASKPAKHRRERGFTLIELLVVIIILGILAAVAIPVYLNQKAKATNTLIKSDISNVHRLILAYGAEHGTYPSTGGLNVAYANADCTTHANPRTDYVPNLDEPLPQPPPVTGHIALNGRNTGCYIYASNGTHYVLSAWNLVQGNSPNTSALYRRLGFRELSFYSSNGYLCNNPNIGGAGTTGPYGAQRDYYKWAYTVSNIDNCDETPPAGA